MEKITLHAELAVFLYLKLIEKAASGNNIYGVRSAGKAADLKGELVEVLTSAGVGIAGNGGHGSPEHAIVADFDFVHLITSYISVLDDIRTKCDL